MQPYSKQKLTKSCNTKLTIQALGQILSPYIRVSRTELGATDWMKKTSAPVSLKFDDLTEKDGQPHKWMNASGR